MARNFTTEQLALLRADQLQARLLSTWYMDDGTHYYCDDVNDLLWNGNTFIGANAFASAVDIRSAANAWAAESITITIDGTRLLNAGVTDPGVFFNAFLGLDLTNRRVDIDLALMASDVQNPTLAINLYAGKINNARLIDPARNLSDSGAPQQSQLQVVLDSLAVRYQWIVGRTRSHEDQLEIDPTDHFFSYVADNQINETTLYWGKKSPTGIGAGQQNNTNVLNNFHLFGGGGLSSQ